MLALRELIFIVKNNRIAEPELVNLSKSNENAYGRYFWGILEGVFKSEEEAAKALYRKPIQNPAYQKFKKEFKKKLVNYLFFLNLENQRISDRQKAYYSCQKDFAAIKILLGQNAWKAAVDLCFKVLKKARKFEFTDLAVEVTRTLRLYYSTREGNLKKYEKYNAEYHHYKKVLRIEEFAEELYTDLVVRYVKNKSKEQEAQEKAANYYKKLKKFLTGCDSYWCQLCGYLIELASYSNTKNYERILEVCDRAIAFFEAKDYQANVALQIFYYQKIVIKTQQKDYKSGKLTAEKGLTLVDEGSSNWFLYQERFFLLSMHTGNYAMAFKIYHEVVRHKRYKFQPAPNREFWNIYEAFLYFLFLIGKLTGEKEKAVFEKFRFGKFLNNTPIFLNDKRGMNIPILIAQTIILIAREALEEAGDKIASLQRYTSRYLTQNLAFRSNCFIKMLVQIPISDFHHVAVERKALKYVEKLNTVPLEVSEEAREVEIIPYEDLWSIIVELLASRR
ncbi:MAG: hypothetical protein KDC85_23765 [Saprospiraceae bacterium]|nr:hypothetical protein [Saprospiraceae bacterium]MCB9322216.1 hypothetical protein [Lewinellaceae bacterium]